MYIYCDATPFIIGIDILFSRVLLGRPHSNDDSSVNEMCESKITQEKSHTRQGVAEQNLMMYGIDLVACSSSFSFFILYFWVTVSEQIKH